MDDGRRRHYGTFYGIDPMPGDSRPVLVVHGNCQAESVRVLLAGGTFHAVRIPPVHELTVSDLPHLRVLLARTQVLMSHPVRSGYRGLPIGTEDCRALLPHGARLLRFPIVRYLGLHPYQAIIRPPGDPSAVPDGVPYHDLRTLTAVRDGVPLDGVIDRTMAVAASPGVLRQAGEQSLAELARREQACDVTVADAIAALLPQAGRALMHTINHPGNAVLVALARRLQRAAGVAEDARDPGRVLLSSVDAPLEPAVLAALGLPGPPVPHWCRDGGRLQVPDVVRAQVEWYRRRPEVIEAGLIRHADRISLLGL